MSNGVEVIVRGTKTTLVGLDGGHTPWLPHKVIGHPSRPVTLPAYTVSRHFHLIDKHSDSKKPANQIIAQLLQSIVRSSTPDLVTKTMLTTFTYLTTVLNKASNTVVKSREEVISNVMTQKFRPTLEYTASLKLHEAPTSFAQVIPSSWVTRTLTTTYVYFNTFTAPGPSGGDLPYVYSSTETIANVLTLPAYLDVSSSTAALEYGGIGHHHLMTSTLKETETYYSTYTFSKSVAGGMSTTRETITQVVVTQVIHPAMMTPIHPSLLTPTALREAPHSRQDFLTKTYLTTYTHRFTERLPGGGTTVRSSTRLTSDLVTERLPPASFEEMAETPLYFLSSRSLAFPLRSSTIEVSRTLTPVMLYATKVYFTTYTYFTTVRNKGAVGTADSLRVHSRTQVVSRVVTEALSTAFDLEYVAQLKSSYLKEHSSLVDVMSQVQTIIPTKTIDLHEVIAPSVTLDNSGVGVVTPHWPKEDDLGPHEIFDFEKEHAKEDSKPSEGIPTPVTPPRRVVTSKIVNNVHKLSTPISSSEEHFDEVKEEVKEIVNVLTNTQVTPTFPADVYPTATSDGFNDLTGGGDVDLSSIVLEDIDQGSDDHHSGSSRIPVSHLPTPPLDFKVHTPYDMSTESVVTSSTTSSLTSKYKVTSRSSTSSRRITDEKTNLDMFPDIGNLLKASSSAAAVIIDFPTDLGGSDLGESDYPSIPSDEDDEDDSSWKRSTSVLAKRTGTIIFDNFSPKSPTLRPPVISPVPTSKIAHLISALVDDLEEERSPEEEEQPQKVYDMGQGSLDLLLKEEEEGSSAYISREEIQRLNATLQAIKREQDKRTTTTEQTTTESPTTSTTTTTNAPPEEPEEEEESPVPPEEEEESPAVPEEEEESPAVPEEEESPLESPLDQEEGSGVETPEELPDAPPKDELQEDIVAGVEEEEESIIPPKVEEAEPSPDVPTPAQEPPPPQVLQAPPEKDESVASSSEEASAEESSFFTLPGKKKPEPSTKRPSSTSKRPNSKRPQNKRRPVSLEESEEDDDTTQIYALSPSSSSGSRESEEEEMKRPKVNKRRRKKKPPPLKLDDEESLEISSEEDDDKRRKKPSSSRPTGPSKSGLTFPLAAAGVGSAGSAAIATAATSAFNWKPLLNLGAIGLGGLGASGLTKLGPLFNSVAGYMKGALIPTIARNDTFHSPPKRGQRPSSGNNELQRGQRPYSRLPPKEAPVRQGKEPVYIPLKDNEGHNVIDPNNFRFNDPSIPRRPVLSTANEPNNLLRPKDTFSNRPHFPQTYGGQYPQQPPHVDEVMNFHPPEDLLPNIFTQMDINGNALHKHGNPPQPDTRPGGSHLPSHHAGGGDNVIHIVPGDPFAFPPGSPPQPKTTDFFSRPLNNLINSRPSSPFPTGKVTKVTSPAKDKPRPGSVEVINEIRDYPRQPPQTFLPQRNHFDASKKPSSLPWPFNTDKFQKDPFNKGQFSPPRATPPQQQHPHDSFEAEFQPENHADFFNQPGFISEGQFSGGVTTPRPLRRPPPTHPPLNNAKPPPPPRLPGEPPMLPVEMNPNESPIPPHNPQGNIPPPRPWKVPAQVSLGSWPGQDRAQEVTGRPFGRPQENTVRHHEEESHLPEFGKGEESFGEVQTSEESVYRPHGGHNDLHRPQFNDLQRPQFNDLQRPQFNDLNAQRPPQGPPRRPPPWVKHSEEDIIRQPPPMRNNPSFNERPQGNNNDHFQRGQRPPPPPPEGQNHVNGLSTRIPSFKPQPSNNSPGRLEDTFPSRRPQQTPQLPEEPSHGSEEEFLDYRAEDFGLKESQRPPQGQRPEEDDDDHLMADHASAEDLFHAQHDTHIRPPPSRHILPSRAQRPPPNNNAATVYVIEHEDESDEGQAQGGGSKFPGDPERSNILRGQQHSPGNDDEISVSTAYPQLIIKEVPTRPVAPYAPPTTPTTTTTSPPRGRTTPVAPSPPPSSAAVAPTTNKALISRLFIRRFSTTPRTAPPSASTTTTRRPPFQHSTMLGLPSGLGTTPSPFGRLTTRSTTPRSQKVTVNSPWNLRNRYGTPSSTTTTNKPTTTTQRVVEEEEEYLEEEEEEEEELRGAGSNVTEVNDAHPNHHPIHKPPIDVAKYLEGGDEFGQLYQGTEDSESVIDPLTSKVIVRGPPRTSEGGIHNHRLLPPTQQRNLSSSTFMRRTTTLSSTSTTEDDDAVTELGLIDSNSASTLRPPSTLRASEEDAFLRRYTAPSPPSSGDSLRHWWPTTYRPASKVQDILEGQGSEHSPRVTTYRPSHKDTHVNEIPSSLRPAPQSGMASFYDDEDAMKDLKVKNKEIHRLVKRPLKGHEVMGLVRPSELSEYEASLERLKLQKGTEEGWEDNNSAYDEEEEEELFKATQKPTQRPLSSIFRRPAPPQKKDGGQEGQSASSSTPRPSAIPVTQKTTSSNAIQLVKSVFPQQHDKGKSEKGKEAEEEAEEGSKVNGGHRESSYIYSSEYYEEDEEEEKAKVIPPKPTTPPEPKTSSIQLINRPPQRPLLPPQQRFPQRPPPPSGGQLQRYPPPGRLPPGIGGHKVNNSPPSPGVFKIFQSQGRPQPPLKPLPPVVVQQPPPKTEMEPPPIDSYRLAPPVLELPSSGPIRFKPSGPANAHANLHRPNLLRPDDDLFKKANDLKKSKPPPTIHTIASVDENNAIIGTNTFTAVISPSKSSGVSVVQVTKTSEVTPPPPSDIQGSEGSVTSEGASREDSKVRVSSVVKYKGGQLSTEQVHLEEDTPPEEEEESGSVKITSKVIEPTKTSAVSKVPSRSRGTTTPIKTNDTTSTSTTTTTKVSTSVSSSRETTTTVTGVTGENVRAQILLNRRPVGVTQASPTSPGGGVLQRRPFIPTRGPPGPNVIPWAKRTQSTTPRPTPTTIVLLAQSNRTTTAVGNAAAPGRNASAIIRFTPGGGRDGANHRGNVRLDLRRPSPSTTTAKTIVTSSVSSSSTSRESTAVRRPGGFFSRERGSFSGSSEEEASSSVGRRVVTPGSSSTSTPTTHITRKPSFIFQNATSTSTPSSLADDEEYEEYSYEVDEVVTLPPRSTLTTPNVKVNVTMTSSTSTSSSQENVVDSIKTTQRGSSKERMSWKEKSSKEVIEPTKVRGGSSRERSSSPPHRFRPASGVRPSDLPNNTDENDVLTPSESTRYVTSTESVTVTVTETETVVVTEGGMTRTGTVFITKTVPPATRISTLVGSVTLVNTVDIKPTVVMTTIFADSTLRTRGPVTFFDSTEVSSEGKDLDTEGNDLSPHKKTSIAPPTTSSTSKIPPGIVTKKTQTGGRGKVVIDPSGCPANCSMTPNQACRTWANGTRVKCDCRAGYARMKDKYPCRPTFTYEMRLSIEQMDGMTFDFRDLSDAGSEGYVAFIGVTKEAVDKAFLSTDIKRQFLGSEVISLSPVKKVNEPPQVKVSFLVQLTTNISDERVRNHLLRTLKAANFSVGRNSGITAARNTSEILARDFNECGHREFHDCSPNAECVNVKGSFTCRCKAGFKDRMKRRPGRDCQETPGCAECNFKGTCHVDSGGKAVCNCFKWYGGAQCQINLKLPLIAVSGIGSVLFILVVLCGVLFARRSFSNSSGASNRPLSARIDRQSSGRFLRYRSPASVATLERTAIMGDSGSSEGRTSPPQHPLQPPPLPPPVPGHFTPDSLLIDVDPKVTGLLHSHVRPHGSHSDVNLMNFSLRNVIPEHAAAERGGGSALACVIPRAKYRPQSRPNSRHASVGADPSADLSANERRLLSYLDNSPYAHMGTARAGGSGSTLSRRNDPGKQSANLRKLSLQEQRKISQGALVSSGTEVSAIGGMRRKSAAGLDPPLLGGHADGIYSQYDMSVSEVRSFDETIRSPAKAQLFHHHHQHDHENSTRASCYSCKPPSYCTYSESAGHTMGDKDGASTVYTTQGKLFRLSHDHDDGDTSSTVSSQ